MRLRAPADQAEEAVLATSLTEALRRFLTPREADVVSLRFGLDREGVERTLGEVGERLGMSRERARQLEAEALAKLRRATPFREQFKDYAR
jgi:RNA polymerase primary sigma factor